MVLYLMQHGESRPEAEDPARDLTEKGRRDVEKVANHVGKLSSAVSRIFHSGKTRAQSTAEILAAALQPAQGVHRTDGLAPLDDPGIWAKRSIELTEDAALVGHLPHLARLAALLITGDPEKNVVNFKMGGLVALRRGDDGPWAVEWLLIPEIIS